MKYLLIILIASIGLACAPYGAHVGLEKNGDRVAMESAGGSVSPERYDNIERRQDERASLALLHQKLQEAADANDWEEVERIQRLIRRMDNMGGMSSYGTTTPAVDYATVRFVNLSDHPIKVESGPFAGYQLGPGEQTEEKLDVPVGIHAVEFSVYWKGTGHHSKRRVNLFIKKDDIVMGVTNTLK